MLRFLGSFSVIICILRTVASIHCFNLHLFWPVLVSFPFCSEALHKHRRGLHMQLCQWSWQLLPYPKAPAVSQPVCSPSQLHHPNAVLFHLCLGAASLHECYQRSQKEDLWCIGLLLLVIIIIIISMRVRHLLFRVHPIMVRSVTGVPEVKSPVSRRSALQISYCFFK